MHIYIENRLAIFNDRKTTASRRIIIYPKQSTKEKKGKGEGKEEKGIERERRGKGKREGEGRKENVYAPFLICCPQCASTGLPKTTARLTEWEEGSDILTRRVLRSFCAKRATGQRQVHSAGQFGRFLSSRCLP